MRTLLVFVLVLSAPLGASAQCGGSPTIVARGVDRATGADPTPYASGPVPPALAGDARRCEGGDAAGCRALADHFLAASRDEARARALFNRGSDLARPARAQASGRPITARAALRAFRAHWARVVYPSLTAFPRQIADAEAACMTQDGGFRVRRVSRRRAHQITDRLVHEHGGTFRPNLLDGRADALGGGGWVWEVMFGGGSGTMPPWGAFVGYVDAQGRVLVTLLFPEG